MANDYQQKQPAKSLSAMPDGDRTAQLEKQLSDMAAQMAVMQRLLAAQSPVTTPLMQDAEREAEFEKKKEWLTLSCKERTQKMARERWKDSTTEFVVSVADMPEIYIPARSPEEGKGRYDSLCGINGVDSQHKYRISGPVPAPQQAA